MTSGIHYPTSREKNMTNNQEGGMSTKNLIVLVLVAITISVVVTLLQTLILGRSNVAITGGIVGALTVGLWLSLKKKKTD
jgi:flagellar basal body-associated protein FliL